MVGLLAIIIVITFVWLDFIDASIGTSIATMMITIWAVLHAQKKTDERFLQQHKKDLKSEAQKTILEKEEVLIKEIVKISKQLMKMFKNVHNLKKREDNNLCENINEIVDELRVENIYILNTLSVGKYYSGYCGIVDEFNYTIDLYSELWEVIEKYLSFLIEYYPVDKSTLNDNQDKLEFSDRIDIKVLTSYFYKFMDQLDECRTLITGRDNIPKQYIRDLVISSNSQK